MKVVLIHPPHLNSTDDRLDPPMGLLYIAAHLERENIPVEVVDLSGTNEWDIPSADIYGITAYVSSLDIVRDIVYKCLRTNPSCKIVVGGSHPSARPEDFAYADYVVRGPGESKMVKIVTGKDIDTDFSIFPSYHLIDIKSYHRTIVGKSSLPYFTSRGCPFKCSFCGLATMHKLCSMRMTDPFVVSDHIERIKIKFGINRINFQDDIFTYHKRRLFVILDQIRPLNIKFKCMGRAGYDTEDIYERLAEAGCVQVAWGIESGSQKMLDRMNKRVTVKDNYNVIKWAKKYGITSRAFFILGFPGETKETIEETKEFIEKAQPDQTFVSNFVPYPGTDVGDNPVKYGITSMSYDWSDYYQVSKDGTGGVIIDTKWLNRKEMRKLELEFRSWLKTIPVRGETQQYERRLNDRLLFT